MNVKNNKRRLETQQKIEAAFCEKLQHKSLQQIEVSEICETAQIERSTFYDKDRNSRGKISCKT